MSLGASRCRRHFDGSVFRLPWRIAERPGTAHLFLSFPQEDTVPRPLSSSTPKDHLQHGSAHPLPAPQEGSLQLPCTAALAGLVRGPQHRPHVGAMLQQYVRRKILSLPSAPPHRPLFTVYARA